MDELDNWLARAETPEEGRRTMTGEAAEIITQEARRSQAAPGLSIHSASDACPAYSQTYDRLLLLLTVHCPRGRRVNVSLITCTVLSPRLET